MRQEDSGTRSRIYDLDLLRFLAALSVVFFHYTLAPTRGYIAGNAIIEPYDLLSPLFKYGYLGVQLFFLISGFVILMSATSGSLKRFVISRMVRLYPAFWVCCTITFIATLLIGEDRYSASFSQYLINMTMLSGFVGVPSIDGVYWTLFIELQFYALVALLLLLRQIHRIQLILLVWLATTITLEVFPASKLDKLFLTDYSPYFIAGALGFLIYSQGLSSVRIVAFLGAYAVTVYHSFNGLQDFEQEYYTNFDPYTVTGIISVFFILVFLVSIRCTGALQTSKWSAVGALTYPLYLIHQHLGYMGFNLIYPALDPLILLPGIIVSMIAFSYLVHQKMEQRCSKRLKKVLEFAFTLITRCLTNCWEACRLAADTIVKRKTGVKLRLPKG